jgi:hypothetical protein
MPAWCFRTAPSFGSTIWRDGRRWPAIDPLMENRFEQSALQNQVMTAGLSRYTPFSTSGQMGVTPYLFRSGFNAGISFCEDCRPADYPRDLLRQAIAEGKRIRKYYSGDLYCLSEVTTSPKDWCVLQYHRVAERDGMVDAFRRHLSPYVAYAAELRAIDPAADYEVTRSPGFQTSPPERIKGERLKRLKIEVDDRPGATILEYRKIGPNGPS